MNIKTRVEKLEQEAHGDGKELCQHLPPIIRWPDGRIENESNHACAAPRLIISLRYSDGSDEASARATLDAFDKIHARFPDLPAAKVAEIVANEFCPTPENKRALVEYAEVSQ